jgi:hypothetical protein
VSLVTKIQIEPKTKTATPPLRPDITTTHTRPNLHCCCYLLSIPFDFAAEEKSYPLIVLALAERENCVVRKNNFQSIDHFLDIIIQPEDTYKSLTLFMITP